MGEFGIVEISWIYVDSALILDLEMKQSSKYTRFALQML